MTRMNSNLEIINWNVQKLTRGSKGRQKDRIQEMWRQESEDVGYMKYSNKMRKMTFEEIMTNR